MCMNPDITSVDSRSLRCFIFTSILLKNSSFTVQAIAIFRGESGCKDKSFFPSLPNLFQSFFKLFSRGVVSCTFCLAIYPFKHSKNHAKTSAPRLLSLAPVSV